MKIQMTAWPTLAFFMTIPAVAFSQSPTTVWMHGTTAGGPALLAFTPDNQRLVTQFSYGSLKVWQVSDGTLLGTINAFNSSLSQLYSLAMSWDGGKVAVCGVDTDGSKMKILSVADGSTLLTIPGVCSGAAFSPDGSMVAVRTGSGLPGAGIVYSASNGSVIWQVENCNPGCSPRGDIAVVQFTPDGLLGVGLSPGFRIYTVGNSTSYQDYSRYGNANLFAFTINFSGNLIAFFNGAGTFVMERNKGCAPSTSCPNIPFLFFDQQRFYPVFSPDGTKLVTGGLINGSTLNYLRVRRTSDFAQIGELQPETGGTTGTYFAISADGQTLATSTNRLMLWNAADLSFQRELSDGVARSGPNTLIYSADSQYVLRGNEAPTASPQGNDLYIRATANGSLVSAFSTTADVAGAGIYEMAISPDGQSIALGVIGSGHLGTRLIRSSDGALLRTIATGCTKQLAFLPDGTLAAADGCASVVRIFRPSDGALLRTIGSSFPLITGSVFGLTADGQTMVTSSLYGTILWRVSDGAVIRSGGSGGNLPAITPNGQYVAVTDSAQVRIHRASDLAVLFTLNGHTNFIQALQFSPDNKFLASAGRDGIINFWRVSDGALLQTYNSGELSNLYHPISLRYAPDGRTFVYGRSDGATVVAVNPLYQPPVASVTVPTLWPLGGTPLTATVTLSAVAPSGGTLVTLASSNPAVASVPASVLVPAGQTAVTFPVTTPIVLSQTPVTVSATSFGAPQSVLLNVLPRPTSATVGLSPAVVIGGSPASGVVTLNSPAPGGGILYRLLSTNPAATVPVSVLVPAGSTVSPPFPIQTTPVAVRTDLAIVAAFGGSNVFGTLSVRPPSLNRVTLVPAVVVNGTTTNANTVTLTGPAPAGGIVINLSSANPAVASVPPSVTIPAGSQSATFPVTTGPVPTATTVVITATQGTIVRTASIVVTR
jgi:WD40 repeat protein